MGKITAGDKGGFSYSPPKAETTAQDVCPKCSWGLSRVVKAADRVVEVACINADCDYLVNIGPGGDDETPQNMPAVRSDDDMAFPGSLVWSVRSFL